jgi:hypothetical protein
MRKKTVTAKVCRWEEAEAADRLADVASLEQG